MDRWTDGRTDGRTNRQIDREIDNCSRSLFPILASLLRTCIFISNSRSLQTKITSTVYIYFENKYKKFRNTNLKILLFYGYVEPQISNSTLGWFIHGRIAK